MRRLLLTAAVLVPLLAIGGWVLAGAFDDDPPPAAENPQPRAPLLPNLVMPELADVRISWSDDGARKIFFSATIGNAGDGPFILHAQRTAGSSRWLVTQRFLEDDGSTSEAPIPAANMVWGGHGHNHWHVKVGASYRLVLRDRPDEEERSLQKAGFCFFDQKSLDASLPKAPPKGVYSAGGCNGREATAVEMGLSIGWSDPYYWLLPDQRVDVTGLAPGTYRLIATADPDEWFRETVEDDNRSWVDVELGEGADGNPTLEVLDSGTDAPAAP